MSKKILFSLENCVKCMQTKNLLGEREDIEFVTLPHDISEWSEEQLEFARSYDVLEDLKRTAPILWVDGEKKIGYLQIRKWLKTLEENTE